MNVGLVGYGGFGRFLHKTWGDVDGVHVTAVASLDALPDEVRTYAGWEGPRDDGDVDLVCIATPPYLHAEIAAAMMEAGKHVLVEKPVATTLADADRLIEVRDRTGRVAAVDFMLRFDPIVEALAGWKTTLPFGRLRRAVVENHAQDETLPPAHWFWDPAQSGGILVEHAVHFLDLVGACTDARPVQVDGWSYRRNARQEDRVMATVAFDDGLVATHYHAFDGPAFAERTTIRLRYDLADIELEGWVPLSGRIRALVNPDTAPALAGLPNYVEAARRPVPGAAPGGQRLLEIGGSQFSATEIREGSFDLGVTKEEAYAGALRAMLEDVRRAIGDPSHRVRVPLEAGREALRLALAATEDATRRAGGTRP